MLSWVKEDDKSQPLLGIYSCPNILAGSVIGTMCDGKVVKPVTANGLDTARYGFRRLWENL